MKPIMLKNLLPERVYLTEEDVDPETKKMGDELKKMMDTEMSGMKMAVTTGMKDAQVKLKGKSEDDAERLTKSASPEMGKIIEDYKIARIKESKGEMTKEQINELVDPFTAASIALALPKIIEWIGKLAKKIAQKFGGSGDVGAAIEHFAHTFHNLYLKTIRKSLDITLFMIPKLKKLDEAKKNKIAEIFFYAIVASVGFHAGTTAMEYLDKSELFHGAFEGLMAAIKGGEVSKWVGETMAPILKAATA